MQQRSSYGVDQFTINTRICMHVFTEKIVCVCVCGRGGSRPRDSLSCNNHNNKTNHSEKLKGE